MKAWRLAKEQEKSLQTAGTSTVVNATANSSVIGVGSTKLHAVVTTAAVVPAKPVGLTIARRPSRFNAELSKVTAAAAAGSETEATAAPVVTKIIESNSTAGVASSGTGGVEVEEEEDPLDAFMRSLEGVDHITAVTSTSTAGAAMGVGVRGNAPTLPGAAMGVGVRGNAPTLPGAAVAPVPSPDATKPTPAADADTDTDAGSNEIEKPAPTDDMYSRDMLEEEDFLRSISSFGAAVAAGTNAERDGSPADNTISMEDIMGGGAAAGTNDIGSRETKGVNVMAGGGWESDASTISIASHSGLLAAARPRLGMAAEAGYSSATPSGSGFGAGGGSGNLATTGYSDDDVDDDEEERQRAEFIAAMRQKQFQLAEAERRERDRERALTMAPVHADPDTKRSGANTMDVEGSADVSSIDGTGSGRGSGNGGRGREDLGVIFQSEGDIVDEATSLQKEKGALELLEEAKKGKELRAVDHSSITYAPFRKNLYIVPKVLSRMSEVQVKAKREELSIKVRGKHCPAPVETWEQCGLSDRILDVLRNNGLIAPFAIQKQSIPALMCGRDLIGVAKTGSGKTLSFLLPLFRHVLDQPPLRAGEGPLALIMAPARELAFQIRNEARKFCPMLGLRVCCIYGGVGVADQIAELKRGVELVVCTPGRMIDILTMQAGRMVPLKRITMVVLDEADRMFDMGFEPQIRMIMQNIRPDRQTVLFSATFPKAIEKLAKSILKHPLEIVVGDRSCVNKDITQYAEVHDEGDKYMRLLQLLGLWYDKGNVIIFVDSQDKCDSLFQDLLKSGYPCVSLHGGKDQLDRDHTIYEFKNLIKTIMIATSVAGRGLDVPETVCVVNYSCPNHYEDYVHRVGRTGRAGRKGTAYTFISSQEDQHAHVLVKAMESQHRQLATAAITAAGVVGDSVAEAAANATLNADSSTYIPAELATLAASFKAKVDAGDARFSSSMVRGGKGFTFESDEQNEAQKLTGLQRREYNIEQGILDKDGKDDRAAADNVFEASDDAEDAEEGEGERASTVAASGGAAASLAPAAPAVNLNVTLDSLNNSSFAQSNAAAAALAAVDTATMTPMERALLKAKQAAMKVTATGRAGIIPASNSGSSSNLQTMDTSSGGATGGLGASTGAPEGGMFSEELEFNDFPAPVRKKVTMRNSLEEICDKYSVAIIPKGTYIAPNKTTSNVSANIHLLTGSSAGKGSQDMLMLGYTGITTKDMRDKEKEARVAAVAAAANPLAQNTKTGATSNRGAVAVAVAASQPPVSEKKLFLLIEGTSELLVRQAKQELLRIFNAELIAHSGVKDTSGRGGSMAGGGRYSVT